MDANRFDSFARSIASWTSRRRFVGGLAGAAAGGFLGANQARAQGEEEPDPEVLQAIAEYSGAANSELLLFSQEIEAYRQWGIGEVDPDFDPFAFDPRMSKFISDLITLTERGKLAAGKPPEQNSPEVPPWNNDQLTNYLVTARLIVGAVSAGGDTDAQLYQYAVSVLGGRSTPEATPVVTETCNCIDPQRAPTCSASCLDVWTEREEEFTASGDMRALAEAFYFFMECFIWKGSITANAECLSTLIDSACAAQITCSCSGDCR